MGKKDFSNYQNEVIGNYYKNLDDIMLRKLGELVTELYLAESEKKRDKLWERAKKAMENLKVSPRLIEHITGKKDAEILAKNLEDWIADKRKK